MRSRPPHQALLQLASRSRIHLHCASPCSPQACLLPPTSMRWRNYTSSNEPTRPKKKPTGFDEPEKLEEEQRRYIWRNMQHPEFAILGGGVTGLSTAYYLLRYLPQAKITIYEAGQKLGGWLRSTKVDVGDGEIIFEQGPRTLRSSSANGHVTVQMLDELGLEDQMIVTEKDSDSAKNRFLYYPDHLVKLPQSILGMLQALCTEEIFKGIGAALLKEAFVPKRPDNYDDESVGAFLARRFGSALPDNIASAGLHGIYAGDIYKLSAKSLMPSIWHMESVSGSLIKHLASTLVSGMKTVNTTDFDVMRKAKEITSQSMRDKVKNASVYTFHGGLVTMANALESKLRAHPNVQFKLGEPVNAIRYDQATGDIQITTAKNPTPQRYFQAISTIPANSTAALAPSPQSLPSLATIPSVTVMVVNLFFRDPSVLPVSGFGYLIPRTIPYAQNPEFALGVVFDSGSSVGQDTVRGTKVTVMLGGHWWDDRDSYPDAEEGEAMAKAVLRRHLNIEAQPEKVLVSLHKDCIPQYTVGHTRRMRMAHAELWTAYRGRLIVAGSSYTGVGVNDCVAAALEVADTIAHHQESTGLERLEFGELWENQPSRTFAVYGRDRTEES